MKIGFVNQPIDCILPPFQSSIGACTYGAARPLARQAEVIVYGIQERHEDADPLPADNRSERLAAGGHARRQWSSHSARSATVSAIFAAPAPRRSGHR